MEKKYLIELLLDTLPSKSLIELESKKIQCTNHCATWTPLAPKTTIQIKELDYCHHPQIESYCFEFFDVSNWFLVPSSFITRDICRVSLVVLLLHSTTWSFFITQLHFHSHSPNHNHNHKHVHTHKTHMLFFWYCDRSNLIHLYFMIDKYMTKDKTSS